MKKLLVAAAALLTLALAGNANAADLARPVLKAPPPAPVYSWTGCYVAGGFGYGMYDIDHNVTNPIPGAAPVFFDIGHDNGGRGWLGTVGVGCDYQFVGPFGGNWLIGALADYDWMNIKGNYSYNCPGGCAGPTGYLGELKERDAAYFGGRLGWVVNPSFMTYISGGWTRARFNQGNLGDATGVTATLVGVPSQTFNNGWFIGGGTEYQLGWFPGLFWRSEYRFAQYQSRSQATICLTPVACNTTVTGINAIDNAKPYVQTVRSELVWRFNWGGYGPVRAAY
jgi:outer membrane immunogenic protein